MLNRNSNYEFQGHFHDYGFDAFYDAGLAWVIVASDGTAFVFGRTVHISEAGAHEGHWHDSGNKTEIADKWAALAGGFAGGWAGLAIKVGTGHDSDWANLVPKALGNTHGTIIQTVITVVTLF